MLNLMREEGSAIGLSIRRIIEGEYREMDLEKQGFKGMIGKIGELSLANCLRLTFIILQQDSLCLFGNLNPS